MLREYSRKDEITYYLGSAAIGLLAALAMIALAGNANAEERPDFTGNWRGTFNYVGANTPLSTGWAAADFLLGLPNSVSYRGVQSTVQPRVTRPRYASYVQDEWKVAPKLTVNLGLRWEYLAPLTEDNNMLAQFDLTSKQIVVAGINVLAFELLHLFIG